MQHLDSRLNHGLRIGIGRQRYGAVAVGWVGASSSDLSVGLRKRLTHWARPRKPLTSKAELRLPPALRVGPASRARRGRISPVRGLGLSSEQRRRRRGRRAAAEVPAGPSSSCSQSSAHPSPLLSPSCNCPTRSRPRAAVRCNRGLEPCRRPAGASLSRAVGRQAHLRRPAGPPFAR